MVVMPSDDNYRRGLPLPHVHQSFYVAWCGTRAFSIVVVVLIAAACLVSWTRYIFYDSFLSVVCFV
jgi:hypothetical protein